LLLLHYACQAEVDHLDVAVLHSAHPALDVVVLDYHREVAHPYLMGRVVLHPQAAVAVVALHPLSLVEAYPILHQVVDLA
jgi:hypothetical protein